MNHPVEINPSPEDTRWLRRWLHVLASYQLTRDQARRWLKLLDLMERTRDVGGI